ncbi:hypothetical protein J3459_017122 [Metarhizium acridum]|uniref:DUF636 domain protein n=1 Tax=Metarhizium acridum (strain CQMa 102) TaxID=655827 RepID=E9DYZ9_METAQ|nr:DUF636 domain protein [Metarhizium acridum CQMa 102]EFY91176.1 DUF636 domain protein [Metarhizium acridum CQMa 102]KAG8410444.1 hypothetical protein J3459_017122 [Metarhizium acridum]KAG8410736.1 hypothetical protein J3458_016836 [Metarhizium acridum]
MGRKFTASLLAQFLAIRRLSLAPSLKDSSTCAEYESSPGVLRGFCSRCGSSLSYRSLKYPEVVDVFIGSLDEKWLSNHTAVAKILATPSGYHAWLRNLIPGITDLLKGCPGYVEGASSELKAITSTTPL